MNDMVLSFGVDELVEQLRTLRLQSLESRQRRDHPPKLPSKKILAEIVDNLGAVLFPNRLGFPGSSAEAIKSANCSGIEVYRRTERFIQRCL
jgi:hypothetical protein